MIDIDSPKVVAAAVAVAAVALISAGRFLSLSPQPPPPPHQQRLSNACGGGASSSALGHQAVGTADAAYGVFSSDNEDVAEAEYMAEMEYVRLLGDFDRNLRDLAQEREVPDGMCGELHGELHLAAEATMQHSSGSGSESSRLYASYEHAHAHPHAYVRAAQTAQHRRQAFHRFTETAPPPTPASLRIAVLYAQVLDARASAWERKVCVLAAAAAAATAADDGAAGTHPSRYQQQAGQEHIKRLYREANRALDELRAEWAFYPPDLARLKLGP